MKQAIPMPLVAGAVVLVLVALVFYFIKATGTPEPTAKNLPDYSKMKPEDIMAAHGKEAQAERDAMANAGRN